MDESPVSQLRQKLFHAHLCDDRHEYEGAEAILEWGQRRGHMVLAMDAAGPLIQHFFHEHGKLPEWTAAQSVETLATLLAGGEGEGKTDPPPEVIAKLAGRRVALPLFYLLWEHRESFVDWHTIGEEVWDNAAVDPETMSKAVQRLNDTLLKTQRGELEAQYSNQSGARIHCRTNNGQT